MLRAAIQDREQENVAVQAQRPALAARSALTRPVAPPRRLRRSFAKTLIRRSRDSATGQSRMLARLVAKKTAESRHPTVWHDLQKLCRRVRRPAPCQTL